MNKRSKRIMFLTSHKSFGYILVQTNKTPSTHPLQPKASKVAANIPESSWSADSINLWPIFIKKEQILRNSLASRAQPPKG